MPSFGSSAGSRTMAAVVTSLWTRHSGGCRLIWWTGLCFLVVCAEGCRGCRGTTTPLHDAALSGSEHEVEAILLRTGDRYLHVRDEHGFTPLCLAAMEGHMEVARVLVVRGADPSDGSLPWAVGKRREEMVRFLLAHGAVADRSALVQAVSNGDLEMVELLLTKTVDVDAWGLCAPSVYPGRVVGRGGISPLCAAARGGHTSIAALLLARGARVDASGDSEDYTPLMYAALRGETGVVQLLLSHGADPTKKDKEGKTALMLARERRHREVVGLLERAASTRPAPR